MDFIEKLTLKQCEAIRELAERYALDLVVLFGSQATGHSGKESDVDIAFLPSRPLTGHDDIRLNYECTILFQTDMVDTTNLQYASALLLQQVADQGKVLYDRTGTEMATLQAHAAQRYVEAEPLFIMTHEKLAAL